MPRAAGAGKICVEPTAKKLIKCKRIIAAWCCRHAKGL
jgi:hypothetical protein